MCRALQMYQHLRDYTCPSEQRWIVRILLIVPIYSLDTFLALLFFGAREGYYVYFDAIGSWYEGMTLRPSSLPLLLTHTL